MKNIHFDAIQLGLSVTLDKLSIAEPTEAAVVAVIQGKLLAWLIAYLTNRNLAVRVYNAYSH